MFCLFFWVFLFQESQAGGGTNQGCTVSVTNIKNLTPWVLEDMTDKMKTLKGMPIDEIAGIMDNYTEGMITNDNLIPADIDILQAVLANNYGPNGELILRIYIWDCFITLYIKW